MIFTLAPYVQMPVLLKPEDIALHEHNPFASDYQSFRVCIYSFSIVIKHLHNDLSPCTVPCLQLAIAVIAVKAASVCMEGSTSKMPSQYSRCSPCDGCQSQQPCAT